MSFFDRFLGSFKKSEPATPKVVAVAPQVAAPVAARPVGAAPVEQDRRSRDRKNANPGVKALIIDDSATVVAALRKMLRSAGYITRDAADAERGLELIAEEKPDLIFLDIVLPGMNGFAALRVIRKDPWSQHIPVIMISGNEHATEQFYVNRIGADDFMKKPFSRFEVFDHIETLLDDKRIPRRKGEPAPANAIAAPAASTAHGTVGGRTATPYAAPAAQLQPVPAAAPGRLSALDARKELTAMGLQYFSQGQFFSAIRRGDQLAVELFITSGGVSVDQPYENETALGVARQTGMPALVGLLQRHATPAARAG